MNTIKKILLHSAAVFCCLLLTGCNEYQPGKLRGTVYRNKDAGFRLETPEEFTVLEPEHYDELSAYTALKQQAEERNVTDVFVCEYAAKAADCEVVICSEPNTQNDTEPAFLNRICNRLRDEETEFEVRELDIVQCGDAEFKSAFIAAHAQGLSDAHAHSHGDSEAEQSEAHEDDVNRTHFRLYVKAADDGFVYMLISYPAGEAGETQRKMLLDSIR